MSEALEVSGTKLTLAGELTFASVPDLYARIPKLLPVGPDKNGDAVSLDLSRVTRADSAGLVLLVGIKRGAAQSGREIEFFGAPEQLIALAQANKLDTILGLS